jgi:hypothetical protein
MLEVYWDREGTCCSPRTEIYLVKGSIGKTVLWNPFWNASSEEGKERTLETSPFDTRTAVK